MLASVRLSRNTALFRSHVGLQVTHRLSHTISMDQEAEDLWLLIAHRTSSSLPVFLDDLSANNHVFRYFLGFLPRYPGLLMWRVEDAGWTFEAVVVV